jgi:site-specific DNA recombinase
VNELSRVEGSAPGHAASTGRAAIYLRSSPREAMDQRLSIERQRTECVSVISARGWELVGEYVDTSINASDVNRYRPRYGALVGDFEAGKYDALVCFDLDRLTRHPRQLEHWIDAAEFRGLALVTANDEADPTNHAGRLFARTRLGVGHVALERKSAGRQLAARQRAELGRPPLGVRLTGYTVRGEIVPHEAEIVKLIFAEFLARRNLRDVADALETKGITTRHGGRWHPTTVLHILGNPRYAGRAVYRGEMTGKPGAWVPLVSEADYEAVQAVMAGAERLTNRTGPTAGKHLGSGLYVCAVCGQHVTSWSRERYRCSADGHVCRSQRPVDEYVQAVIAVRLARPEVLDLLAGQRAAGAQLADQVARIRVRLARNDDAYDAGYIDGPTYSAARDRGAEDLQAAQSALAAAHVSDEVSPVLSAHDPPQAFLEAPLAVRRSVIDLLAVVALSKGTRGSKSFDPDSVRIEWRTAKPTAESGPFRPSKLD